MQDAPEKTVMILLQRKFQNTKKFMNSLKISPSGEKAFETVCSCLRKQNKHRFLTLICIQTASCAVKAMNVLLNCASFSQLFSSICGYISIDTMTWS